MRVNDYLNAQYFKVLLQAMVSYGKIHITLSKSPIGVKKPKVYLCKCFILMWLSPCDSNEIVGKIKWSSWKCLINFIIHKNK